MKHRVLAIGLLLGLPLSAAAGVDYVTGANTTVKCEGDNCGKEVLVFKYKSGPEAVGGDKETGITKCVEAGAKPVVVVQAVAIAGGAHGSRYNVAVCVK